MNFSAFFSSEISHCLIAALLGYLLGSVSFAVVVSRLFGLADPRSYGSGNPGATNVLRSGSKGAAILTLLLDALKAFIPVWLAKMWGWPELLIMLIGLGAFLGHIWPVFFRFEGGKGVATAAGALLGFDPLLGLGCLGAWLAVAVITRYSSLSALSAALLAPVLAYMLFGLNAITMGTAVMGALLIWRHEANIRKLLAGQESKIGQKST